MLVHSFHTFVEDVVGPHLVLEASSLATAHASEVVRARLHRTVGERLLIHDQVVNGE